MFLKLKERIWHAKEVFLRFSLMKEGYQTMDASMENYLECFSRTGKKIIMEPFGINHIGRHVL